MTHVVTCAPCAPFLLMLVTGERCTVTHERLCNGCTYGYRVDVGGVSRAVQTSQVVPLSEVEIPEPPGGWRIASLRPALVVVGDGA